MEQNNIEQKEVVPVTQKETDHFLPISILVAALLISGSVIYTSRANPSGARNEDLPANVGTATNPGVTVNVSDLLARDVIIGDKDAPITLIEYGDYQCPFCGKFFAQTEPSIRDNYIKTGKVRMIYRDFAFLGTESTEASEAAECSKDQGKFAAYHDELFNVEQADGKENNGDMDRALFLKLAKVTGMDVAKFTECYDSNQYASVVTASRTNGTAAGVSGTPATFVNGQEVEGGAQPYATYQALFESILSKK